MPSPWPRRWSWPGGHNGAVAMGNRFLADAVVVLHLAFILYAAFGGLPALRYPRTAWCHLPAVVWAGVVECAGWTCPLTYLENHFRTAAGLAGYPGGFIEHYLIPVIYPEALTRAHQILLGGGIVAINAVIYARMAVMARRSGLQ